MIYKCSKMRVLSTAACVSALVLTGCTTEGAETGSIGGVGEDGGLPHTDTVRGAWITDPTGFNPAQGTTIDDTRVLRLAYDTVLRRDLDGELIPGLAESWEQGADSVRLTIGEGHTCADGTPITASVVADSLSYLVSPDSGSALAELIFGPAEVMITADDSTSEVLVELDEPHAEVAMGLAVPSTGIICPAGLDDLDGLAVAEVEGGFSGPYIPVEINEGVSYVFELREDYDSWPEYSEPLEGTPASTLEFVVGAEESIANQLTTGELDVAPVGDQELVRFEGQEEFDFATVTTGEFYIMFNRGETSPFQDEDMRRALAQIIDREALRDIIGTHGELTATLGDETMPCANTDFDLLVDYDAESGREALSGVPVNVIGTNAIGQNGAGAVYVQEQLLAAGADVELRNLDVGTWVGDIYNEPESWDVTVYSTVNNLGTMSLGLGTVIGVPYSEGGRNISLSNNVAATEAFEDALSAGTDEEMCEHYRVAQEEALASVDFIPISMNTNTFVVREGFAFHGPGGSEDLTTLRVLD